VYSVKIYKSRGYLAEQTVRRVGKFGGNEKKGSQAKIAVS
jgi:hypothetical protein